jgi:hypothetical protein
MNENEFGEEAIAQDGVNPFSEILQRMEETNNNIVVPILKKIESNTAQVRKANSTIQATRERVKVATAIASKVTLPGRAKTGIVTAEAKPVNARNSRGRFVSSEPRSHAQDVNESSGGPHAKKGRLSTLVAFALQMGKASLKDKKGTMAEAAGRATLGPMFDAVMEVKDQFDNFREKKNNLKEQYGQFKGQDAAPLKKTKEGKDDTGEIVKSLQKSGKDDEKRHKELIKVLKRDGANKAGLPYPREIGPRSTQPPDGGGDDKGGSSGITDMITGGLITKYGGKLVPMVAKLRPLLAALPLGTIGAAALPVGLGITAATAVGSAGYSAVTGKDNFISKGAQALGLVPKIETDANGKITGGYKEQRGNIAEASKATGISDDTLTKMAGVESSFNSQAGASTSSAKGTYQFTNGTWKSMLKKHGGQYGLSANTSVMDPRANALMGAEYTKENKQALEAAGVKADDTNLYMSHFLGTGGGVKFAKTLQSGGGDREAAGDFKDAAGANKNIFYDKSGRARSYKEIHSLMSRRMNQYSKDRMESLASGQSETAVASAGKPVDELKAERAANNVDAKTQTAIAKPVIQEPVTTAIATSDTAAKVKQPERIQPSMDYVQNVAGSRGPGAGAVQNGATASSDITVSGLDRLIAMLSKSAGKEEERYTKGGVRQIQTEFDDTMLTLMAYDRV